MALYTVKVLAVDKVTHDVIRITTAKPGGYSFEPGQATEVSINKEYWHNEKRPFTFTCLPEDDHLEFTIKTYPSHQGVTNQLLKLEPGDELTIGDSWGAIAYKGEGVFIAGGAGITPFISIFRYLSKTGQLGKNKLLFANKRKEDIILEKEFRELLGDNMTSILSEEAVAGHLKGFITRELLATYKDDHYQKFYVCGPPPMMDAVLRALSDLHIADQAVVTEI